MGRLLQRAWGTVARGRRAPLSVCAVLLVAAVGCCSCVKAASAMEPVVRRSAPTRIHGSQAGSVFSGASIFSATDATLPPYTALTLEGDALTGSVVPGAVHYAVLTVPPSTPHVVLDAHSCTGDVDIAVAQVATVSALSPRSFPTLQRHGWSSTNAWGTPDSVLIYAPVGRLVIAVVGVGEEASTYQLRAHRQLPADSPASRAVHITDADASQVAVSWVMDPAATAHVYLMARASDGTLPHTSYLLTPCGASANAQRVDGAAGYIGAGDDGSANVEMEARVPVPAGTDFAIGVVIEPPITSPDSVVYSVGADATAGDAARGTGASDVDVAAGGVAGGGTPTASTATATVEATAQMFSTGTPGSTFGRVFADSVLHAATVTGVPATGASGVRATGPAGVSAISSRGAAMQPCTGRAAATTRMLVGCQSEAYLVGKEQWQYFVLVPPAAVGIASASTCVSTNVVATVARGEVSVMTRLGAMPTLTDYDAALSSIMADHASPGVQVPCLRPSQRYIVGVYGGAEGGSRFTVQAAEIHSDGTAPRITVRDCRNVGDAGWVAPPPPASASPSATAHTQHRQQRGSAATGDETSLADVGNAIWELLCVLGKVLLFILECLG